MLEIHGLKHPPALTTEQRQFNFGDDARQK